MKPFKSTTMLRPLTDAELQLEDPQWEDDDTVTFYIPCWFNVDLFFPAFMASGMWDTAVNILVSFVCAVQVESFRKVNGHSVATTMCTGNLRSATEQIFHYVRTRDPDTRKTILSYYEIVVFFALGATLGAALSALFAEKAILFCCLFLIIAFLSMFAKEI